jgi:ribose/xylose/arabinose/galactoside ABC-type transport system permease subunit
MHPFIVTLGTLSIFRGIALIAVKEGSLPYGDKILPPAFTDHFIAWAFEYTRMRGDVKVAEFVQPVPMLLMLLVMVLGWIYLRRMVWGRETYAVGGNEEAARFSGISIGWVKMRVYLISGLCAGIAGMISAGFYKSAATNTGLGYELMVVASAVVGGASLVGGRGTALGAVLGALIIQMIDNGISILYTIRLWRWELHVSKEYTQIIIGVAIIVAVAVDRLSDALQQRRLARMGRH